MAKSKTDIIKDYLANNPKASGKEAAEALKKHGITAQYFYVIKSKLAGPKKKAVKKKVAKKKSAKKVGKASQAVTLTDVAELAKRAGGLDKLAEMVEQLKAFQV